MLQTVHLEYEVKAAQVLLTLTHLSYNVKQIAEHTVIGNLL